MRRPHALVLPYPAHGHIVPLLELSYCLVDRGFAVTFVHTDFDYGRIVAAMSETSTVTTGVRLVSVPHGLGADHYRNNDAAAHVEATARVMPQYLEELIRNANESPFTCLIADLSVPWAFHVARRMNLRSVLFCPTAAGVLLDAMSIPRLLEDGFIDEHGMARKIGTFKLSPEMPAIDAANCAWNCFTSSKLIRVLFDLAIAQNHVMEMAEFILCNSASDLEPAIFAYAPKIQPIGPLLTGRRAGKAAGDYLTADKTCNAWLDEQAARSVIYVAFGSTAIFDENQFQELAFGLELTGRPFLWVVRPDLTGGEEEALPEGWEGRVGERGRTVRWAPQQEVLAHPAIACFVSHCGWNSTMDGVRNGVPLLCWPYFGDQPFNQGYICDVWKIGLRMGSWNDGGHAVVPKEQIAAKVEELLGDEGFRSRALVLKGLVEKSLMEGGSSFENLNKFVNAMKLPAEEEEETIF